MKRKLLFCAAILLAMSARAGLVKTVSSPDGRLVLNVHDENGKPMYDVLYDGQQMLEKSALGLKTNLADFTQELTVKTTRERTIDENYSVSRTKTSAVHYVANELTVCCEARNRQPMNIVFRVANNDVAFRYELPQRGERAAMLVNSEASAFKMPEQTKTFICPQASPMIGWMRTKPSYEEEYVFDGDMNVKSRYGCGYTFPCLFHQTVTTEKKVKKKTVKTEQDYWILISETGVNSQYCASHLSDYSTETGYTIAFPDQGENNGFGSATAQFGLPGATPWRTITVGNSLKPVVETTVMFDVVEPLYEAKEDYKPGKYTWSWIVWQDASVNFDDQKKYIDLARDMGAEYCLIDGLWDKQIGWDRMPELFSYAHAQGVTPLLWFNSNGGWNDAPQGAKQCMNTSIARKKTFAWLKQNGVKGIKVDFFGGDKQETIRLYEDILSDANEAGVQVIFHGCTLPRGWERMYPNYAASEAVLASENCVFNQHFCDMEATNGALHPFCRNTVGAMDWGGTFLNKRLNRGNNGGTVRKTTDIYELASAITIQASLLGLAVAPNNLTEQPDFEFDFLRTLPTAWDETRFVDGYPGKFCVLARRAADKWYVAGINGEEKARTMTLSLPMFAGQKVKYYVDEPRKEGEVVPQPLLKTIKVDKKGLAKVTIQPQGGIIICK